MGKHHHKVSPEPQPETDEAEPSKVPSYTVGLNWAEIPVAAKPKIKAATSVVTVDIASLKMAAYVKKRQDMKERVVREVFEAAMPDTEEFDMDDAVLTVEPLSSEPLWKRCLKFFGLMNLTLHEAVMSGSVRHVKMTMTAFQRGKRANPQLVDAYDENGQTALLLAVKVGRRDICDELVYGGNAKVDYVDIRNGMTPLMYAIMGRHVDIVRMLLREGASLTMCDFKCTTPLMMAAATGMVPMLEAVGGQYTKMVDAQDEKGWTALHWAVFADSPAAIVYLLDVLVANRDIKDHERKKPYHLAAFLKYGDCESVLMDKHMKMAVAVGDHLL